MKKQVPTIILAVACLALLVAYINAKQTGKQLRDDLAQLKAATDSAAPVSEIIPSSDDKTASVGQPDAAEQIAASTGSEAPVEDEKPSSRRMMENMAKMMENPTMNKVMEASQRGAITALYDDLINYLNLNEEEKKYFMDLLMHRQMKQVELGMKMMSGQLSDEEKQALQDEIEQAQNTVKEEMEKFLNNPDDYAEWEFYEKTMGERMMLSQMDKDLAGSDSTLSDNTYRDLLGMMHDERENFQFTSDFGDQQNTDMSAERFSKKNVQNFANDIQQLNNAISSKAQGMLTPEQYTAFASSLKATTDMQLSQLEMAAQMFGGNNEGDGAK